MLYLSTFAPGFETTIEHILPSLLPSSAIDSISSGLIVFRYGGNPANVASIPVFNNSFHAVRLFRESLSFSEMLGEIVRVKNRYLSQKALNPSARTFRVRFLRENRFEAVSNRLMAAAETEIKKALRLSVDRVNPDTEFWYMVRKENAAFYAQLLEKRAFTEKKLNKGELRPEFALLTAFWANIRPSDIVFDPFAGYGAIPLQIFRHIPFHKLMINDIEKEKVMRLRGLFKNLSAADVSRVAGVFFSNTDFFKLSHIPDKSIDKIVTDPPWGLYDDIGDIRFFYTRLLTKMACLLKDGGEAVILTSRKSELEQMAKTCGYLTAERLDTLVNGKKASLFKLRKPV